MIYYLSALNSPSAKPALLGWMSSVMGLWCILASVTLVKELIFYMQHTRRCYKEPESNTNSLEQVDAHSLLSTYAFPLFPIDLCGHPR